MPTGDATDVAYNPFEKLDLSAALTARFVIGYGTGTAYTLTNTGAAIVQGTTSPTLVIPTAGTWMLYATVHITTAAATFAAVKNVVTYAYRTNNTPGAVTGMTVTQIAPIITTATEDLGCAVLPPTQYVTANANDALTLYSSVATLPSAGTILVVDCAIWAARLY